MSLSGARRHLLITLFVALGSMPLESPSAPPPIPHGVVLFYEDKIPPESLAGLENPSVTAGELIAWWGDIEREEGVYDWSRIDANMAAWRAQGKRLDVRLSGAHNGPNYSPAWLFRGGRVRRVGRGPFADFEGRADHYAIGGGAGIDRDGDRGVLRVEQAGEWLSLNETLPPCAYSIQWDERVRRPGSFTLVAHDLLGGHEDVLHPFGRSAGQWRGEGAELELPAPGDWRVSWLLDGEGAADIDNVLIVPISESRAFTPAVVDGEVAEWRLAQGASLEPAVEGASTPAVRLSNASAGPIVAMRNEETRLPMRALHGYAFQFRWRAEADTHLIVRLRRGDVVLSAQRVEMKAGEEALKTCWFAELLPEDGYEVEFVLDGPGEVVLRDLAWRDWSQRVPVFPDFFSEEYRRCWSAFVEAFARRYNGDPALGVVSVGGFGRWEEVMLDEDLYDLLTDQWIARGFTRERYLAQIEWCLDLYKRHLDRQPLRVCLAYGLHDSPDVDWFYYRVAQACARRGIGLKQNGMSEKYDTWNANTNTSYLYARYADRLDVSLTHETGGQIYRNTMDAHGHPLSLFNRVLLNQTDVLFLYGGDVSGRHIRKYHHYMAEQMGRSCLSQFYAQLGDYPLVNEHSPRPVSYRNNWMGLRQFQRPGAEASFHEIDGEKCASTGPGNDLIVFDVDDRWQHAGLFGVVLSVSYFDSGTTPFRLSVFDQATGQRRELGRIARSNTRQWKTAAFVDSAWCGSRRNHGEDVHEDVFVEHLDGEHVTVRNVEMRFVAASEWKMARLAEREPLAGDAIALGDRAVVARVALDGQAPVPCAVEVPLAVSSLAESIVGLRVFGTFGDGGEETLLADKEYYMPADGDWARLAFAGRTGLTALRVEATATGDNVAWKRTAAGDPCVALLAYETHEFDDTSSPQGAPAAIDTGGVRLTFSSPMPFCGLRLDGFTPTMKGAVSLWREAPSLAEPVLVAEIDDALLDKPLCVEPQPPGTFALTVRTDSALGESAARGLRVKPLVLQRSREPRPATMLPDSSPVMGWPGDGLAPMETKDSAIGRGLATPSGLALPARPSHSMRVVVANRSGNGLMRLYWRGDDASFSSARSVFLPIVPNDPTPRTYSFPVGFEATWQGTIDQILLVPGYGNHAEDADALVVESLDIEEQTTALALEFEDSPDSLEGLGGVGAMTREAGCWRIDVPAGEVPWLAVPRTMYDFDAEPDQRLMLRLRVDGATNGEARFRWHALGHPTLDAAAALRTDSEMSVAIPLNEAASGMAEYRVDLGASPAWKGRINGLGFSPFTTPSASDATVWIDAVRIERDTALPQPLDSTRKGREALPR